MTNRMVAVITAILLCLFLASVDLHAATVSGTLTTNLQRSSGLFVRAGEKALINVNGTFVLTWVLEESGDGGSSYREVNRYTGNLFANTPVLTRDALFRVGTVTYTSGTATYSLDNVAYQTGRDKFPNIEVGSVAYGSLGSVNNSPVAGTLYTTDLVIERQCTVTHLAVLNGATVGTDKYNLSLFDSTLRLRANTPLAGTTTSGANAFQEIAVANQVTIEPGRYHLGVKVDGTTDRTRFVAGSTFVDVLSSATAHSNATTGSFGSPMPGLPADPTTFTAGQAPISYVVCAH